MMYRQYEDPRTLEQMLTDAQARNDGSPEAAEEIADLKERINFAWQDEEAEINGWE